MYAKDVYRFVYWLSGDAEEAKDITAETFVRLWTMDMEARANSLKALLFIIARNLFLQGLRKSKRRTTLSENLVDSDPQPDQQAETTLELQHTMNLLQAMPELDRSLLLLRAEGGLSYEEIARCTGLTLASVKVKIFRTRKKLQSKTLTTR